MEDEFEDKAMDTKTAPYGTESFAYFAENNWRTLAPNDYDAIEDKTAFFTLKGEVADKAYSALIKGGANDSEAREIINAEYLMPYEIEEEDEHECLFCYPGIQMLGSFGTRMRAVREVLEYCACELPFEVLQIEDSEDVDEDGDTVPDEDDDDVEDRLITKYGSWKAFITEMRAFVIECWDNQDARLAANPDPTATRLRDNEKVQRIFMRMLPEQCIEIDS